MRLGGRPTNTSGVPSSSRRGEGNPGRLPRGADVLGDFVLFRKTTELGASLVFFEPAHLALIVVFGTAIGLMGSLLSVGRHLRHV